MDSSTSQLDLCSVLEEAIARRTCRLTVHIKDGIVTGYDIEESKRLNRGLDKQFKTLYGDPSYMET